VRSVFGDGVERDSAPNRFAVIPSHVLGDVEWVVETGEKYWVVEKRPSAMASAE